MVLTNRLPRETKFASLLVEPVRNGIYKAKQFHGRGVKMVNMGELFAYPRLRDIPMKRVDLSASEKARFSVHQGDLLFARRSLVAEGAGKCCVVIEATQPMAFESSIIRARPDPSKADSLFLYYYFNSPMGLHALDTIRRQVAVAGITGTDLANLCIRVPPRHEQRTIARILAALDDKIELYRRVNETLDAIARAIFKDWFVDFGPVRANMEGRQNQLPASIARLFPTQLAESRKGEVPATWHVKPLRDCFNLTMGQSPPGSSYNEVGNGLPFFQGRKDFGFRYPDNRRFCATPSRIARSDDTLVSVRAPVGDINMAWAECCIGRGVAALRHDSQSSSYTYYAIRAIHRDIAEFEHSGTVFGSITRKQFEALSVVEPDPEIVRVFDAVVSPMDQRIRANVAESRNLTRVRDVLLSKLISGEIRAPQAEKMVEAVT